MLHIGNFLSSRTSEFVADLKLLALFCNSDRQRTLDFYKFCKSRTQDWNTEDAYNPSISACGILRTSAAFRLPKNSFVDASSSVDKSGIPIGLYMLSNGMLPVLLWPAASNSQVKQRPTTSLRRLYTLACCKVDSRMRNTVNNR